MAELTNLERSWREVLGLAQAAQGATQKVRAWPTTSRSWSLRWSGCARRPRRPSGAAGARRVVDGKKTAILEKAHETKNEATAMMQTYLGEDSDALDGFEFLTMAEAGEVGHWEILGVLPNGRRHSETRALVEWALPIQERHLADVRAAR